MVSLEIPTLPIIQYSHWNSSFSLAFLKQTPISAILSLMITTIFIYSADHGERFPFPLFHDVIIVPGSSPFPYSQWSVSPNEWGQTSSWVGDWFLEFICAWRCVALDFLREKGSQDAVHFEGNIFSSGIILPYWQRHNYFNGVQPSCVPSLLPIDKSVLQAAL